MLYLKKRGMTFEFLIRLLLVLCAAGLLFLIIYKNSSVFLPKKKKKKKKMLKKKGLIKSTLIGIIILIFSFILILGVINLFAQKSEPATAEATCRLTLAAHESVKINTPVKDIPIVPRICPIIDVEADSPDKVYEYMARCKAMYGDFLIEDVFKEGIPSKLNCRPCFYVTTKKSDKFPKEGIDEQKIVTEMANKVYKVESAYDDYCKDGGGFCVDTEKECYDKDNHLNFDNENKECIKKGKKGCCYSLGYGCLNKGGVCKEANPDENEYAKYSKPEWRCYSGTDCYINKENYYSYLDYIQKYRGEGGTVILTPIKANEIYAIAYGSPTEECDWCNKLGIGSGILAGVGTAVLIGSTSGLALIPITAAGVVANIAVKESFTAAYNALKGRKDHVIYLATPEQLREADSCNPVE